MIYLSSVVAASDKLHRTRNRTFQNSQWIEWHSCCLLVPALQHQLLERDKLLAEISEQLSKEKYRRRLLHNAVVVSSYVCGFSVSVSVSLS